MILFIYLLKNIFKVEYNLYALNNLMEKHLTKKEGERGLFCFSKLHKDFIPPYVLYFEMTPFSA